MCPQQKTANYITQVLPSITLLGPRSGKVQFPHFLLLQLTGFFDLSPINVTFLCEYDFADEMIGVLINVSGNNSVNSISNKLYLCHVVS